LTLFECDFKKIKLKKSPSQGGAKTKDGLKRRLSLHRSPKNAFYDDDD